MKRIALTAAAIVICTGSAYWWGSHTAKPKIRWYSQMMGTYVIDREVTCPNGKNVGRVQVDYDLTNGKWKTVRNDPGATPDCTLPPPTK